VGPQKLLERLRRGTLRNVSFGDMTRLVEAFGFELRRVSGSHHIYAHPSVRELLNLQEVNGDAKPYQIRQFLKLIERYSLRLEDRP
jgi:predicted RNA binding protein YcfA (HicA-like mRNA interferase family)